MLSRVRSHALSRRPGLAPGLVVALTALLGAVAHADLSAEVTNGDKIKSSLFPASEAETFTVTVPKDALLTVKGKGSRTGPAVRLQVLGPGDVPVTGVTEKGQAAFLSRFICPASGEYVVTVTSRDGTSTGDYGLVISWKSTKKVADDVSPGGGTSTVALSADAGTLLGGKIQSAKGSTATPTLGNLTGPDGFMQTLTIQPDSKGRFNLGAITLPSSGDYQLEILDSGATGQAVAAALKLKGPKLGKRKIDVRSKLVSGGDGEELVVAKVLGAAGGTVLAPEVGSSISGAGVTIPSGALALPTAILVGTAAPFTPRKGGDTGAGPAVLLGPEKQKFATPVTVTIPFDAASFDGDFSQLRILTRDASGRVTEVPPPYTIDEENGTCSFPASHFSSFRAFRPGIAGNPEFAGIWRLIPDPSDEVRQYLEIFESGQLDVYNVDVVEEFCLVFREQFPSGTRLSDFLDIRGGELVFPQDSIRYRSVPRSELPAPEICTDITPPEGE